MSCLLNLPGSTARYLLSSRFRLRCLSPCQFMTPPLVKTDRTAEPLCDHNLRLFMSRRSWPRLYTVGMTGGVHGRIPDKKPPAGQLPALNVATQNARGNPAPFDARMQGEKDSIGALPAIKPVRYLPLHLHIYVASRSGFANIGSFHTEVSSRGPLHSGDGGLPSSRRDTQDPLSIYPSIVNLSPLRVISSTISRSAKTCLSLPYLLSCGGGGSNSRGWPLDGPPEEAQPIYCLWSHRIFGIELSCEASHSDGLAVAELCLLTTR